MSIMTTAHPKAADYEARVRMYYTPNQPNILATEVLEEVEKRCGAGQQYTTFPNKITDAEKAKVEALGYKITRNYIDAENRDGATPNKLYIGFQVALNPTAAKGDRPMQISQKETNGISGGGGGDDDYTYLAVDDDTYLAVDDG